MRTRQSRELRREDLAKAALRVIVRQGLGKATVREVAREAGCSPGLITHYARTMDDLLLAAAEYTVTDAITRVMTVAEDRKGLDALRRVLLETLPLSSERVDVWKMWISFWDMTRPSERLRAVLDGHVVGQRRWFKRMIMAAQELQEISPKVDANFAADSLMVLAHGIGVVAALNSASMSAKKQRALLDDWIEGH